MLPLINGGLGAVARLRPGISVIEAQQDLASISAALAREFPNTNRDRTLRVNFMWDRTVGTARNALWFLMAAALTVPTDRMCERRESPPRARAWRGSAKSLCEWPSARGAPAIIRQLLTESCVLAVSGQASGGYLLTAARLEKSYRLSRPRVFRVSRQHAQTGRSSLSPSCSLLVNGVTFRTGARTTLRCTASPGALRDLGTRGTGSGRQDRTRAALVMGGSRNHSCAGTDRQPVARKFSQTCFEPTLVLRLSRILASVVLPEPERYKTPEQRARVYRRFLDAVRAIPGVESAGTVDALPFSGENHGGFISTSPCGRHGTDRIDQSPK